MNQQRHRTHHSSLLLADKGDGFRGLPRFLLRDQGYSVLEARHGLEALFLARRSEGPIDMLIAEDELPFLSGLELSKYVHALNPDLKTILLTRKEMHYGFSGSVVWLPRTCPEATFLRTIRTQLSRRANQGTAVRDLLHLENSLSLPRVRTYTAGLS